MQEQVLFNEGQVTVTTARFQVGATMYPIAGITAVTIAKQPPNRAPLLLVALVLGMGLACMGAKDNASGLIAFGLLVFIGLSVLAFVGLKPTFAVAMATAGGQKNAVTSQNEEWIRRIVDALNQAVISRG
jgi:hypothetical protein